MYDSGAIVTSEAYVFITHGSKCAKNPAPEINAEQKHVHLNVNQQQQQTVIWQQIHRDH